jgi:hypothetical protein
MNPERKRIRLLLFSKTPTVPSIMHFPLERDTKRLAQTPLL